MTTKAKRKPQTIKLNGRKYVLVHTSIARVDHKNVVLRLIKRAGKVQWFTLEGDVLVRRKAFWEALKAYSDRQDELGISQGKVDSLAVVAAQFPVCDVEMTGDDCDEGQPRA